jgi:hypothetical protein
MGKIWFLRNYEGNLYRYPALSAFTMLKKQCTPGFLPKKTGAIRKEIIHEYRVNVRLRDDYLAEGYGKKRPPNSTDAILLTPLRGTLQDLGYGTNRIGHAETS